MQRKFFKKLQPFGMDEIQPTGWLREQLVVQMSGLTGKLNEVWADVGSYSGWLGGTGENWERGPYYLDGMLPLAYLLGDKEKWNLAEQFVRWTIDSQDAEGNFGPLASKGDWWSRIIMLKVLIQYYEITKKREVLEFMHRYYAFQKRVLPERPLKQWGKARGGDLLYCIKWLYELEPEEYLINLMDMVQEQSLDWNNIFEELPYVRPTEYYYNWEKLSMFSWPTITELMKFQETHIVNVTMGLKFPAMTAWLNNREALGGLQSKAIAELTKYHGVASGAINGDEHLAGNSPSRGAELCSIVEYMFSLQIMLEVFGQADYGDLLEQLTYNALPATISEDYMEHQYLQQANQVQATNEERNWFNNLNDSNLFGLEPNFGCCTANMHQGWPKLIKSLWYREQDAIISTVFAPNQLTTYIDGQPFVIELETCYPSKGILTYRIKEAKDINMELRIRKPKWCHTYKIEKNGVFRKYPEVDGYVVIKETVSEGDVFCMSMDMEVETSTWRNGSLAVQRGPLLYALDIQGEWNVLKEVANMKDYEIRPKSAWNYALIKEASFKIEERDVTGIPFLSKNPPVILSVDARRLKTWGIEKGSAADVPMSPVSGAEEIEKIKLIPFGCTKLRISQFPYCEN